MLRTAAIPIIFITMLLAVNANTPSNEVTYGPHIPLGVDQCSYSHVRTVIDFVRQNVLYNYENQDDQNLTPRFHDCAVKISPKDDRHHYVANVSIATVDCEIRFSTGHRNKNEVLNLDSSATRVMIKKCRINLEKSYSTKNSNNADAIPVGYIHDQHIEKEVNDLVETQIQSNKQKIEELRRQGESVRANRLAKKNTRNFENYSRILNKIFRDSSNHANSKSKNAAHDLQAEDLRTLFQHDEEKDLATPSQKAVEEKHDDALYDQIAELFNVSEDQKDEFYNTDGDAEVFEQKAEDSDNKIHRMGAPDKCTAKDRINFTKSLITMANKRTIRAFVLYDENILECSSQVVTGMKYQTVLSFNGEHCPVDIWAQPDGTVILLNGTTLAEGNCAGYLTTEELQRIASSTKHHE